MSTVVVGERAGEDGGAGRGVLDLQLATAHRAGIDRVRDGADGPANAELRRLPALCAGGEQPRLVAFQRDPVEAGSPTVGKPRPAKSCWGVRQREVLKVTPGSRLSLKAGFTASQIRATNAGMAF